MRFDGTADPSYIVTWAVLIGGLIWRMGAFVTEVRTLIAHFGEHEREDTKRFKSIDARFVAVDDLKNIVLRGYDPRPDRWHLLPKDVREIYEKVQRPVGPKRRRAIQQYVQYRIGPEANQVGAFPAITVGLSERLEFEPIAGRKSSILGDLQFDPKGMAIVTDGLGRLTGMLDVWDNPNLSRETNEWIFNVSVPVMLLMPGPARQLLSKDDLGQLFHDFNVLAEKMTASRAYGLDKSGVWNVLTNRIASGPFFGQWENSVRSAGTTITELGPELVVMGALVKFVRAATEGPGGHVDHVRDEIKEPNLSLDTLDVYQSLIEGFLQEFAEAMGDKFTDRDSIHLRSFGWIALGHIFHDLYFEEREREFTDEERTARIRELAEIDWSRHNPDFIPMLGLALPDKKTGQLIVNENGQPRITKFHGGAASYIKLWKYLRDKLDLDPTPVDELQAAA